MSARLDSTAILQEWVVASDHDGYRADIYLSTKIGRLTRSKAKRIILNGDFRKPDSLLKPSQVLHGGETVHLWRLPPQEDELDFESVNVLFEDAHWLVLDKPPALAVHPSAKYLYNTLTAWLKRYVPGLPVHPCHRLDRETSGVLVCAKHRKAESHLKVAFQNGEVRKSYLAIVRGELRERLDVNVPLGLQGDAGLVRIRMVPFGHEALPSRTLFEPLAFDAVANRTLVRCEPKTGRQHQIRAHLAHAGFPIVGDKLYAMGDAFFDAYTKRDQSEPLLGLEHERHALHAHELEFEFEGQTLKWRAPVPQDFRNLFAGIEDALKR